MSPRNKWLASILCGIGAGIMAGFLLGSSQNPADSKDDFRVAEAKPLWQSNSAPVVELADFSPFASKKADGEKIAAVGAEKSAVRSINVPEERRMAMPRVFPTIPKRPIRSPMSERQTEQSAGEQKQDKVSEKSHYSSKIAFIGGEGLEIKERQGE